MNYTLNQLRIFARIARLGSITKAAEELHLTQPAVSIQLKNFQQQFEIPLTEVIGRKLYVTDFGEEIAQTAEKILEEVYAIDHKILAHKGKLLGRLRLSIVSTGKYVMPYFLAGFMHQHDGVELQMDVTNKAKVVQSLEKNEVDFSLVSILPEHLKTNQVELLQNKLYLVGGTQQKFAKKEYDKRIFEELPLIYREAGSGTRQTMEKFITGNNVSARKKMELTSNEAVKQALIAGLGYSIMPLIGIKRELTQGDLQIIPVKGLPTQSAWNLTWMADKKFSPVAEAFLNYIQTERANIIKDKFQWFEEY